MHMERIGFLRHTVAEHCKRMPKIEDNGFKTSTGFNRAEMKDHAVFNLDSYTLHVVQDEEYSDHLRLEEYCEMEARLLDEPDEMDAALDKISNEYNCGFSGCFAGWYLLLARSRKFLSEDDIHQDGLAGYDLQSLAQHFGITYHQSGKLFRTLGAGAEGKDKKFGEARLISTTDALAERIDYLDRLIATNGEHDNETAIR